MKDFWTRMADTHEQLVNLAHFGSEVLQILEKDEDWSSDTTAELSRASHEHGLAGYGPHGEFRVCDEWRSAAGVGSFSPGEAAVINERAGRGSDLCQSHGCDHCLTSDFDIVRITDEGYTLCSHCAKKMAEAENEEGDEDE